MILKNDLKHLRKNYQRDFLVEESCLKTPFLQFNDWLKDALNSEIKEPNAMVLTTIDGNKPESRILLLKELDELGFIFYTNYKSNKGQQIEENNNACITFFWDILERQIRINGTIEKVSPQTSNNYFSLRPRASQIGAWVSQQSKTIGSRAILEDQEAFYNAKFKDQEVIPRPPHWGGYRLIPEKVEFWQGRPSRLHDRIIYIKSNNNWKIERLSP